MAVDWAFSKKEYDNRGVAFTEEFFISPREVKLSTCCWKPASNTVKGLVFLLHGYTLDCGLHWQETGTRLAESSFAVFGLDYEGHGKSEGVRAYIKDINFIVDDFVAFSQKIRDQEEYKNKPAFLYGHSLGGAVSILVHKKLPSSWDGGIIQSPMLKISEKMKPHPYLVSLLSTFAYLFPTWAIVPTKEVMDLAVKDPVKLARLPSIWDLNQMKSNPYTYRGRPRLGTALVFLETCEYLQSILEEVTLPFLLLQGEADVVTDPSSSVELYQKAKSEDKTLKLYPGMWHSLFEGELDENAEIVFKDILDWLNTRVSKASNGKKNSSDLPE